MNGPYEDDFDQKKIDARVWKRLFKYAFRHKKLFWTVIVIMAGVALVDILYPLMSRYAIDVFIGGGTTEGLPFFIAFYSLMVALQGSGVFLMVRTAGNLELSISYDIRQEAFMRLQELSFSFYDRTPAGYVMARLISDVARLADMLAWSIVDVMWALAYALGVAAAMLALDVRLALIALSVVPALIAVTIFFQRRILKYQRSVRKLNSRITGAFNEGIMGAMTSKTLSREAENNREFAALTGSMRTASVRSAILAALFTPIVMFLGSVGTGLALYSGGMSVMLLGLSFGTLSAFISYTVNLFEPIQNLANILAEMQSAEASAERVLALIDTAPDITDTPEVEAKYGTAFTAGSEPPGELCGEVEFENVTFAYKAGETVLENFCLKVRAGENIALVGETGSGKSTIVNLVCRFYEPTGGRILIDGVDYRERSQHFLQSRLGYVLQTPHLFSGTIADNIRYGRKDATDEEVREAARLVHAEEAILRQQNGYDTEVGEGGALLSTGEKQLISFARVILAKPRIFVLDEATSSIDTETEQTIQRAITEVLRGRTSFIVAHRLSTITGADRILVIHGGKILEEGTHAQLMKKRGRYYQLYTTRFVEEFME